MAADYIRREDALFALRKAERGGSMTALTRLERAYVPTAGRRWMEGTAMRLIDADEAKKLNKEQCVGDCGCCSDLQDDNTCTLIDRVPTVDDAVIVTRCKNCKWFADNNGGEWYGCKMFHAVRITPEDAPKPDDFCSCGERREGGNDDAAD